MSEYTEPLFLPPDLARRARSLKVNTAEAVRAAVEQACEDASVGEPERTVRHVSVTASVMVAPGRDETAEAFEAVAWALVEAADRFRQGSTRTLVPIRYPLVQFEAESEPA